MTSVFAWSLFALAAVALTAALRRVASSLDAERRLRRQNRYYSFLTRVTATIFREKDPAHILESFCDAAVREGGFALAWAGVVDRTNGRVDVLAASGDAAGYARAITVTTDPALPTSRGPTGTAIAERRPIAVNDFLNDPRTAAWHEHGRNFGLRASASVPVVVDREAVATLNFYSETPGYFDDEMIALLEETARNVALAWEARLAAKQRDLERERRAEMEERYRRIFEQSPLPKLIHDTGDGRVIAANNAHFRLFGYTLDEIAAPGAWITLALADPAARAIIEARLPADIDEARRTGRAVAAPELSVRCKDGTDRVVRAHMTVTGNEAIVTFVDLTDVRRSEEALRESERRFRGMVEQTIAGFYVVRDNLIVYVNPRLSEMTGWTEEEMLGKDPLLELPMAGDRSHAEDARARLRSGDKYAAAEVDWRRPDGTMRRFLIRGTHGLWDGAPAMIAMVEDITERAQAEATIRNYLGRLESAMRGTLQAVARMVDLRDPYTAGHERRVGQIAAAIGRELGWDEARCRGIELVGLVHDIGKIAVPAEILSKPNRLSPTEFAMIKGHAQAGADILADIEFDMPVAEIVRQHHERLDGSGYPRGLKGDAILPEARVLAVADVLESMASHRPYRPALGLDTALAELSSKRGTAFDAAAVDAAVRLVREKGYSLP